MATKKNVEITDEDITKAFDTLEGEVSDVADETFKDTEEIEKGEDDSELEDEDTEEIEKGEDDDENDSEGEDDSEEVEKAGKGKKMKYADTDDADTDDDAADTDADDDTEGYKAKMKKAGHILGS